MLISRENTVTALVTVEASMDGIDRIMSMMRPSKVAAVFCGMLCVNPRSNPNAEQIR